MKKLNTSTTLQLQSRNGLFAGLRARIAVALVLTAGFAAVGTARAQTFAVLTDIGASAPALGPDDISQSLDSGGVSTPDGLNYYFDNGTPPGQTFTTGPGQYGYVLNSVAIKTAGGGGGSLPSGGQAYLLRVYSVSGSTATLAATYTSTNNFTFTETDWLQWTNLALALQPNAQYAYTLRRVSAGWENLANVSGDPYPGGEVCLIPTAGGTITFGSSRSFDATFVVGLSPTPLVPVITQQPISQTVALGQAAGFSVSILGAVPSYQWYTCGNTNYAGASPIPNATNSTYAIAAAAANNATNYFVVITNFATTGVTSSVATLTVRLSVNSLAWLGTTSFNWDYTTVNWSNVLTATAGALYQTGDNVQFTDAGKGSSPIALTANLAPISVTVSSASNYTFAGSGRLAGQVQLTKNGTGTLIINNANTFNGSTLISNGILQLGNASALGAATNPVSVNGGTLDLRGIQATASLQYDIQGAGYTNAGAIANFGGNIQNANGIKGLNLLADATIGAQGRWDLNGDGGGTGLHGNDHNLTKVGPGEIWFINAGTNNELGDMTILRGQLGFQGSNNLGDPAKTISVLGGSLGFYAVPADLAMNKSIVLSNAGFNNSGGSVTLNGPVTLMGTNTHTGGFQENASMQVTFNGPISGAGGWVKNNVGQDIFNGTNSYAGVTVINNGLLTVGANSSLGNSSLVQLGNAAAILDLSAVPQGLSLGSGKTLAGVGSIYGFVTNNAGSTLTPGIGGPGTLNISGSLALANSTAVIDLGSDPSQLGNGVNDYINVGGDLALTGLTTIQVSPVGPLSASSPYTILTYGGALTGGAANLQVVSSHPRYTFSVVNPDSTPNSIQISVSGVSTPLVWKGGKAPGPNVWNHTVTNFLNTGSGAFDRFYDGDLVTFDDTGVTNIVNVPETNSPGLLTLANNTTAYTFVGVGTLGGTLDQEGSGNVTLAFSNTLALNFITNNQGTLILSPAVDSTLSAVISDNGLGLGKIVKGGTNRLTLVADNSAYLGTMMVTNGILRYNNSAALGGTSYPLYASDGGSLDINNVDTGGKSIVIAGSGYTGLGAFFDSQGTWPAWPYEIVHNITLAGNATIGSAGRWDIPAGGVLTGNGFKLTKTGGGQVWFKFASDPGLGDIVIAAGQLGFQEAASMGLPGYTLTVQSNASCGLWNNINVLDKNIVLDSGDFYAGGGSNNLVGLVTLLGTNTITLGSDLHLWNNISGAGGFRKQNGGTLWLDGTNTYTGPTVIGANSIVVVGMNSSLGASSPIQIDGGSTLDVSAPASFNLGAGQTLIGNGTIRGGNVKFDSSSTLAVGFAGSTYTLTAYGILTFQAGSTNVVTVNKTTDVANDKVAGPDLVNMGGTLVLENIGNALAAGDVIQLFSATNYAGAFANIIPAVPGVGLQWNTSTLGIDGMLRVVAVALPQVGTASVIGGNFVFNGVGGTPGGAYSVLAQTNVARPLSNWTVVGTGTFDGSGNFSSTNGITPGSANRFYLIRVP